MIPSYNIEYRDRDTIKLIDIKKILRNLNTTFTVAYPQDVVIINSFHDTMQLSSTLPGSSEVFQSLELYTYSQDVRHMLSRILLQPSNQLISSITNTLAHYDLRNSIAIQIRTGGSTANSKERGKFLPIPKMTEYLQKINTAFSHNETIYLSTDSSSLVPSIKQLLSNHQVIQSSAFRIGHSRRQSKGYLEGMKRAVVDLVLSSHCKSIYTTMGSSYGNLIQKLSLNSQTRQFLY